MNDHLDKIPGYRPHGKNMNPCDWCGGSGEKKKVSDFRAQAVFILDTLEAGGYQFQELIRAIENAAIDLAMEEEKGIVAKVARKINMNRTALSQRLANRRLERYMANS